MTLREKVAKLNSENVNDKWLGGVKDCPQDYPYLGTNYSMCIPSKDCEACWNQEFIEPEPAYTLSEDASMRLAKEYVSKCKCCDDCFCELYCIENNLRNGGISLDDCYKHILAYLNTLE